MPINIQPRVWVLIADGEHARVVKPTDKPGQFGTLIAFDSASAHMKSTDLGSDRPGRVHESASVTRHAVTPRSDPKLAAKDAFLREVARLIEQHDVENAFDRLVLVAPPHALSDLRADLNKSVSAKVVGSLTKDLVKVSDHNLMSHLKDWWLAPAIETALEQE
jgi:protein required for attachment to host cells